MNTDPIDVANADPPSVKQLPRPTLNIQMIPCGIYYGCEYLNTKRNRYGDYCCAQFMKWMSPDISFSYYCYPQYVINTMLRIILPDGKEYMGTCLPYPPKPAPINEDVEEATAP